MREDTGRGLMYIQRDHTARNDELGPDVRITEDQKAAARRVVCSWVERQPKGRGKKVIPDEVLQDAAIIMQALGIHPAVKEEVYMTEAAEPLNCGPGSRLS